MNELEIFMVVAAATAAIVGLLIKHQRKSAEAENAQKTPVQKSTEELVADAKRMLRLMEVKRQAEADGDSVTAQSVLNMTYTGPLPIEKPDGSFTHYASHIISYSIAGINFREGVGAYVGAFTGYLQPEPDNEYDPKAIAVHHDDGHHLGYIPAAATDDVRANALSFPLPIWGEVHKDFDQQENRRFYRGIIYIEIPPNVSPQNL